MKLASADVIAMVATKDIEKAKEFYNKTLGLEQAVDGPAGVAYKCGSGTLFLYPSPGAGTNQATSASWNVANIEGVVEELAAKGIKFEEYEIPGAKQEGNILVMGSMKAAWFKDPDGNTLGLSEM